MDKAERNRQNTRTRAAAHRRLARENPARYREILNEERMKIGLPPIPDMLPKTLGWTTLEDVAGMASSGLATVSDHFEVDKSGDHSERVSAPA